MLSRSGQIEAGLEIVAEALSDIERNGESFWVPDLLRLKGQLLLECDGANDAEAEACFHQAIDAARSQNAKSWELRAATSMARLWHSQDKTDAARDLLLPVYEWFTDGFEIADLKDAKEVLDRLA